ncbi:MAG: alpha/beta fold hydrolase [Sphingomonadales bacterium]
MSEASGKSGGIEKLMGYVAILIVGMLSFSGLPAWAAKAPDPLQSDPPTIDEAFPPAMLETRFQVDGSQLNAIHYLAGGPGPHPTVVLLHGYPGNEKNLDLAQALRRGGWNVFFFHYRGAWGSEGNFSLLGALDDVVAAVGFLKGSGEAFRVDKEHLALVGHSMGGFMALAGGTRLPDMACVAGISAADIGGFGAILAADPEAATGFAAYAELQVMLAGHDASNAVRHIIEAGEKYPLEVLARGLGGRHVLLIAGKRDRAVPLSVHISMVEAFEKAGTIKLETVVLDADHPYSWQRVALARTIAGWLDQNCR